MHDWLAEAARRRPDHPFMVYEGQSMGYAEADDRAARFAGGLVGRVEGRLGIWATNRPDTILGLFAAWRAGLVAVLLNRRLTVAELATVTDRARVGLMLGVGSPDVGVERVDPSELDGPAISRTDLDNDAVVVFTSGSSGIPKGVRLTFSNLEASAASSAEIIGHTDSDRWLANLPLFHVGGLMIAIRTARQASTLILERAFDPARTAELLRGGSASLASLVGFTLDRTLREYRGPYTGVKAVLVGGGPVAPELVERAIEAGLPVYPTYGLTETASQVAVAAHAGESELTPVTGAEIRLVEGAIEVRGAMVTPGYLGEQGRRSQDWLETGDLGELDSRGRLTVLGRADATIVTGGENVHPSEIESVLLAYPGVAEAVVVGVEDPSYGQIVAAVFTGTAEPDELERFLRSRLAGYKVPRRWIHAESIPKLSIGKPDHPAIHSLVEDAWRTQGSGRE